MQSADEFNQYRPVLMGLAYRMLSSVMDAEDMVQEAFLHWQKAPQATIRTPKAYLMTVITRLCIDHLRAAHVQRESYIGEWLPEPWAQDADPGGETELAESLSTAFLLLLERLAPIDRAILLLHDVFNYTYEEIGAIVGRSTADCRQIAHRARAKLAIERPRFAPSTAQVRQVTQQFIRACTDGDLPALLAVLSEDVTLHSDGGGKVSAARNPILGVAKVARFFLGVRRKNALPPVLEMVKLNGQIAVIEYLGEVPIRVSTFEIENGRIKMIYRVVNPTKLYGIPRRWALAMNL